MSNVIDKVCDEKHKAIDSQLNTVKSEMKENSDRIGKVEDAVIMLTNMVDSLVNKDFFDKILILSVFIISLVLVAVIFGPEITGKILGNM